MGAVSVTKSAAASWGQSLQHPAFPSAPREQRPLTPLVHHLKQRLRPLRRLPPGHQGSRGMALSYITPLRDPLCFRRCTPIFTCRHRHRAPVLPSLVASLCGQTVQQLCTPRASPPLVTLSSTVVSQPPFAFHPDLLFAKWIQSLFILV